MTNYRAPIAEQLLALRSAGIEALTTLPAFEAAGDMIEAILTEAAKFAEAEFAPLNAVGDQVGARFDGSEVTLPAGFAEAYARYVEAGWNALSADPAHGGQGMPFLLSVAVQEQLTSANMAFALCPMLTLGAIEALSAHGSDAQKAYYLPKLVSGEWTGTMNLTEPQAGSDVGALTSSARPIGDGRYEIKGTKIFITWGEHDLAPNIVHLVLARLPDAAPGTRGISLFLVPKYLPDGARNGARCTGIEHKLGIHASPTCQMAFGQDEPCLGWLIGPEHGGMRAMFTMMNHARINVGLQGVAIAERACQAAADYAHNRVQSAALGATDRRPVPIIEHADVRRMLATMRAQTEAARALVYETAAAVDRAHADPDPAVREAAKARADLLTPVAKAHATDIGVEVSNLAIQVFGGMGYVEETGVAQYLRDARIAPIYEGTNGIQALDLVMRKLPTEALAALIAEWRDELRTHQEAGFTVPLLHSLDILHAAAQQLNASDRADAAAGATPMLRLFGIVAGGVLLARQAEAARQDDALDPRFVAGKLGIAAFYVDQLLPMADGLASAIRAGSSSLNMVPRDYL